MTSKYDKKTFGNWFPDGISSLELRSLHASVILFAIHGRFCEIGAFPLGILSIHNLKGNGNAPNDDMFQ